MKILRGFGEWIADKEEQPESDMITKGETFYRDLQKWKADLPECMQAGSDSVPQILYLQYVLLPTFSWVDFNVANH